jgi:hypothetical protein
MMKSIFRSLIAVLFLLAFTMPLVAQNPKVAIRVSPSRNCVKVVLKNLTTASVAVSTAELWIFDQKTCRRLCITRKVINKKIGACQDFEFEICCDNLPPASGYIYYVRVRHNLGMNEEWAYAP